MEKIQEKELKKQILNLSRSKKLNFLKDLLKDLGEQYITIKNLSRVLDIPEKKVKKCFRLFDRRLGVTVMPSFLNYPEFRDLWETKDITENPTRLLDLLAYTNKYVKLPNGFYSEEFSYIKSKLYAAKANIIWQLRDQVQQVVLEKQEEKEEYFAITLRTGHQFHQPVRTTIEPNYWKERVNEEREYHPGEEIDLSKESLSYHKAVAELLFYLQKRGLKLEREHD